MIFKSILLAVIVLFGALSVADAQSKDKDNEVVGEGQLRSDQVTTQAVLGWNSFHVSNCYADTNGSFLLFAVESSQINFIFITNPVVIATVVPFCPTGNLMAVFVTSVSGSSFLWNQIFTYTFK
jgi:hypothetical protein